MRALSPIPSAAPRESYKSRTLYFLSLYLDDEAGSSIQSDVSPDALSRVDNIFARIELDLLEGLVAQFSEYEGGNLRWSIQLVDYLFTDDENQVPIKFRNSQLRKYLKLLKTEIIASIRAYIIQLENQINESSSLAEANDRDNKTRDVINSLADFFKTIECTVRIGLLRFVNPNVYTLTPGLINIMDEEVLPALHLDLVGVFYDYKEKNKSCEIMKLINILRQPEFDSLLKRKYNKLKEIVNDLKSVGLYQQIQLKIDAIINATDSIVKNDSSSYVVACRTLKKVKAALANKDDKVGAGILLQDYAKRLQNSSIRWKILGGNLIALGSVLMIMGVLGALVTFGLGKKISTKISRAGSALCKKGAGFFYYGYHSKIANSVCELGRNLQHSK